MDKLCVMEKQMRKRKLHLQHVKYYYDDFNSLVLKTASRYVTFAF